MRRSTRPATSLSIGTVPLLHLCIRSMHLLCTLYSDTQCCKLVLVPGSRKQLQLLRLQERHWKPICLANYMASRDFFTRVLHGYKDQRVTEVSTERRSLGTCREGIAEQIKQPSQDVFRLAFLKLNASNWLSPVRPGLVGGFLNNGLFFPQALMQPLGGNDRVEKCESCAAHQTRSSEQNDFGIPRFWPAGDMFGTGPHGRNIPLYIHQKTLFCSPEHRVSFRQHDGFCLVINSHTFFSGS